MGHERAQALEPQADLEAVRHALIETRQARQALAVAGPPPWNIIPDVRSLLEHARVPGSVAEAAELASLPPLLEAAARLTGVDLEKELAAEKGSRSAASLRVIADHARAVTFLISDAILPASRRSSMTSLSRSRRSPRTSATSRTGWNALKCSLAAWRLAMPSAN